MAGELNYPNYFALEVAAYGMTADEMVKLHDDFLKQLRPLYLQLHTWAKYKLAEKYHQPVPKKIPAHWINNRWSQEWTGLVEAANIDDRFKGRTADWIIKTAEQFYTGLGFKPLPASFWVKSDLYPVPAGNPRKKNTHASCWHIDLQNDIRSLRASSRTRNGSSPRTTSWATATTSWLTRGRRFRRSCASARIRDFTKASAN